MITLFGATGYTGRKIARELELRGLPYRIAGRSKERLEQLSSTLPSRPAFLVADAQQSETLPPLFKDTQLLINCAGPFTDLGEKVVQMASFAGVNYLDTTNELGFVYRLQTYHQMAKTNHCFLLPACAFEIALSDVAIAKIFQKHPVQHLYVVYHTPQTNISKGTRLSALRSLTTSWIGFQDGSWSGVVPAGKSAQFSFSTGNRYAIQIPSTEIFSIPWKYPVRNVEVWMTVSREWGFWGPVLLPYFARFMRSIAGKWIYSLTASRRESVPEDDQNNPFEILIGFREKTEQAWRQARITGKGPYSLTAKIAGYAAFFSLKSSSLPEGLITPSTLLQPEAFFEEMHSQGVEFSFD
ncbi:MULTISPECIES: saccharopine dehydrogenase NADP-binding domain-containing protein [Anaerolinea]|uniref:saccharopine dehydrogenase NADP-binding domain-containing protein n=1 Tax=Anaerolinea TaxID=233189 RepID=UPI002627D1D8|nr:saccharopine dehydrogenase NADP-binding domain-containing protein [Anaerolinea thermophila]